MPESEVRTLILRFRDLSTLPGETIRQHREISEESGHVWWGWWSKLGETVPEAEFRQLDRQASAEGLALYLLDTGSAQLFQARCIGIQWQTTLEPFTAPEEGRLTPTYYQGRRYPAWFKLSEIEPAPLPGETVQRFSYVRVDNFFSGGESRYIPFYGKRIASIAELIPQNRTIWFIRDARLDDPIHEISLLDAKRIEPRDFPPQVRQATSRNLLWLSDLHYSIDNHHGFPANSTPARKSVSSSLRQSLDEDLGIPNLAGCIISGDLTWKADPEEYQPVAFRIVVLHHHLLPVTYREEPRSGQIYSVVLDAEALAQWVVKHRVRLVLHGHMHQPFCAKVARPIDLAAPSSEWHSFHVIGLGSTGVERGHLGTVGKNVFGLLRFGRDRLKVGVHTIDPGDRSQPLWELDIPYREEGN